jgi:histidyl-tRNA synthetase
MNDSMRCRGMRDLLPEEMERFRQVETAFRTACLGWGYREVRTPTIEHLHLFTAAGTLSPQMLERVYSFLDWDGWSGERVVLRPDSTIPVARLYVENFGAGETAKLFYAQSVLRFAEGNDSREDWQCGVELIGDTYPVGDVELILLVCEVLQTLGLTPEIKLSDPGILRAVLSRAGYDQTEQLALYDRVLSGDLTAMDSLREKLPEMSVAAGELLVMEGEGSPFLKNLRSALEPVVSEAVSAIDELATMADILSEMELRPKVAPVLVRNFEYYTGPVFHLFVDGMKVAGGGRYDALISQVGGEKVPASGFAIEMEALWPLLSNDVSATEDAMEIRSAKGSGADVTAAFRLARALREAGRSVAVSSGPAPGADSGIVASADGYTLLGRNGNSRRLDEVERVVRAVADDGPD